MAREPAESANIPWTDNELRQSVSIYVLLLRLQLQDDSVRFEPVAQALLSEPLSQRNNAAIRYRLRNISAVVQELGGPILRDFSPAESVGRLVRPRIRAMLLEDPDFARLLSSVPGSRGDERKNALKALHDLRERIEDLENELAWRGHNGPPAEAEEERGVSVSELHEALNDIKLIETNLEGSANHADVESARSRILALGLKLAKWLGGRTTKFVDVALATAAPIVVAKVTGLLPAIVNVVEAVGKVLTH
ncbi:hypothetical protein [Sphingomonas koreensis]|uniref:hypothetical protein n=1 Tax=Sphingomonas koreensis TaxID=93064 RepID=UPI000F7E016F|nr:hypothetical protein [Sphingomonas koreensis]